MPTRLEIAANTAEIGRHRPEARDCDEDSAELVVLLIGTSCLNSH